MNRFALALAAAAVGLATTAPAFADPSTVFQSVRVMYPDLDLNTSRGTRNLYWRLKSAAQDVCGNLYDIEYLAELRKVEQCQQAALENAVMEVNKPLLTARYDKHFPNTPIVDVRVSAKPAGAREVVIARRGQS